MPANIPTAATPDATRTASPLSAEEWRRMHAWWRACNYLAVGMICLRDNPLLKQPLGVEPELAIPNQIDRFNLVIDVIDRVPGLAGRAAHLKEEMKNAIIDNPRHPHEHGTDRAEITNWVWPY